MNCESTCVFIHSKERGSLKAYDKIAEIIKRVDGEINPLCVDELTEPLYLIPCWDEPHGRERKYVLAGRTQYVMFIVGKNWHMNRETLRRACIDDYERKLVSALAVGYEPFTGDKQYIPTDYGKTVKIYD